MNFCFSEQELDLPYIKIAATEIVSGVSGNSEEKIRALFDKAVVSCFAKSITSDLFNTYPANNFRS